MMTKTKIAFIGPSNIHAAFQSMQPEWDFQSPIESISEYIDDLNKSEDEALLSKDTSIVIVFSRLYKEESDLFAYMAAYMAPYAVTCIIIPESDLAEKTAIESSIIAQQRSFEEEFDYNSNSPFYFIPYEDPVKGIYDSAEDFVTSSYISEDSREQIKHFLGDLYLPEEEDSSESYNTTESDFEESNTNRIVLPEPELGAKGKVISITSSKGGSGKSTVTILTSAYIATASHLAHKQGLVDKPLKVCVIDLDVRDGQLAFLLGETNDKNILNILHSSYQGELTPGTIAENIYHSEKTHCDYIFATRQPRYAKYIKPEFYAQLIQKLRSMYDYIFLDTSVNYLDTLLEEVAYPLSDNIVFVTDVSISSVLGMNRWIQENTDPTYVNYDEDKDKVFIDKDKIGIVINRMLTDVNMPIDFLEQAALNIPYVAFIPSVPQIVTYAANTSSLHNALKVGQINTAIKRVAEFVLRDNETLAEVPSKNI